MIAVPMLLPPNVGKTLAPPIVSRLVAPERFFEDKKVELLNSAGRASPRFLILCFPRLIAIASHKNRIEREIENDQQAKSIQHERNISVS
jgi:hypothetical protein